MDKPVTTRLPEEFIARIKYISNKENIDVSTAIRKLLTQAIKEWKINHALSQYSKGKFSIGQAAEFAEISLWDFPELLKKNKIPINYDLEEFQEDLKTIGWKKK